MTEKKCPVLVTVTSTSHNDDGPAETMCTRSVGEMSRLGDSVVLKYNDHLEEQGCDPIVRQVTMFIRPGRVEMHQQGDFGASSLVFVQGKRFDMKYNTPYGQMDMGVYATRVMTSVEDDRGSVRLQYQIDTAGAYASVMDLELKWIRSVKAS